MYTKQFSKINYQQVNEVGGKNASLGEMYNNLSSKGVQVPGGFATTAKGYWHFIDYNGLRPKLDAVLAELDRDDYSNLHHVGEKARALVLSAKLPKDLCNSILEAYH